MRQISVFFLLGLLLSGLSAIAADASHQEIANDCKTEGIAVGMTGTDLDDYIIECTKDYLETDLSTNVELSKQPKGKR